MIKLNPKTEQAYSSGSIVIKITKNSLNKTRMAFLVGTKFSKKAVIRNKLRRQFREIFRKKICRATSNSDISVMIKNNKKDPASTEELKEDLKKAIEKADAPFKKLDKK